MLRRLGIRAKVLAVLAVPMLVVLFAGVFISWETVQNLQGAQDVRHVVAAVTSYAAVNDTLNDERAISQVGGSADEIAAARTKTDAAIAAFVPELDAIDLSSYSHAVADAVDVAEAAKALQLVLPLQENLQHEVQGLGGIAQRGRVGGLFGLRGAAYGEAE